MLVQVATTVGCGPDRDLDPLGVVVTVPTVGARHPAGTPLRVRFDGYLRADTAWDMVATLTSGELAARVDVDYDPVEMGLVISAGLDLRVGVGYTLTVRADAIEGVDGRVLDEDLVLDFVAGNPRAPVSAERGPTTFGEVAPIFERACNTCHGAEPGTWPPLTADALVGAPSRRRPGRTLVVPGDPLSSELVTRILPDYPGTLGAPMPPEGALAPEDQKRIIDWVKGVDRP